MRTYLVRLVSTIKLISNVLEEEVSPRGSWSIVYPLHDVPFMHGNLVTANRDCFK